MPKIYWMMGYNVREGMGEEYQKFLASKAFKKVCADIEKESGMKYIETYGTVLPGSNDPGSYDCYDFWELPNRAALDKVGGPAAAKLAEMSYKFVEPRPSKSVLVRKASDVRIIWEPKK
ncbi:MAG TPA: hypothetical protein VEB87_01970 [Nitrososphaerales archaeon]|nr:hypothetical protein [Nitrososphaerales archaeon]